MVSPFVNGLSPLDLTRAALLSALKGKYEITWYFLLIPSNQISVVRKNVAVTSPSQAGQEQEQGVKSGKVLEPGA